MKYGMMADSRKTGLVSFKFQSPRSETSASVKAGMALYRPAQHC